MEDITTIFSSLFGVAIGASSTFFIQYYFTKEQHAASNARMLKQIQWQILEIRNDICLIERHLENSIPKNHQGALWPILSPVVITLEKHYKFNTELYNCFESRLIFDMFSNDILETIRFRNQLIASVYHYNEMRREVDEISSPYAQITPNSIEGSIIIPPNAPSIIFIKINECEHFAQQIVTLTKECARKADHLIDIFPSKAKLASQGKHKVRFYSSPKKTS